MVTLYLFYFILQFWGLNPGPFSTCQVPLGCIIFQNTKLISSRLNSSQGEGKHFDKYPEKSKEKRKTEGILILLCKSSMGSR